MVISRSSLHFFHVVDLFIKFQNKQNTREAKYLGSFLSHCWTVKHKLHIQLDFDFIQVDYEINVLVGRTYVLKSILNFMLGIKPLSELVTKVYCQMNEHLLTRL